MIKFHNNIQKYGKSTAASIPIALLSIRRRKNQKKTLVFFPLLVVVSLGEVYFLNILLKKI